MTPKQQTKMKSVNNSEAQKPKTMPELPIEGFNTGKTLNQQKWEFIKNWDFEQHADGIGQSPFEKQLNSLIETACKDAWMAGRAREVQTAFDGNNDCFHIEGFEAWFKEYAPQPKTGL